MASWCTFPSVLHILHATSSGVSFPTSLPNALAKESRPAAEPTRHRSNALAKKSRPGHAPFFYDDEVPEETILNGYFPEDRTTHVASLAPAGL